MISDPFARWDLTPVINASGTMTVLGASRVPPETRALVDRILNSFVSMDELQSRAGTVIARLTGAQAGCVTACSAAGLAQAVAACLTGTDLALIERLPETDREDRIVLPMGHMINYGAPIDQTIRLAGGCVVPIGTVGQCETWHLRRALADGAAAAIYVVSHHTVRKNELPMDVFIALCREYDVPAIVDMASEYDLKTPVALGASVAVYSGHKFLSGVTSGIIAGSEEMVRAVYLQHRGIGRTMKVGKEGVVGAMAALELWEERDARAEAAKEAARLDKWMTMLADIPGLSLSHHQDWTGNPITRMQVAVDPEKAHAYAWELTARLANRRPRIMVRDDLIEHGIFFLDPCNVTDEETLAVAEAIVEEARVLREGTEGLSESWSDAKWKREARLLAWTGKGREITST
jgi:D-glucosaminate-6-phosphate ammonia-lyase